MSGKKSLTHRHFTFLPGLSRKKPSGSRSKPQGLPRIARGASDFQLSRCVGDISPG